MRWPKPCCMHQTVQRCIERAKAEGALAALDERPRPGKEPTITVEAKTWVVALACRKAKELGYPHEVWTRGFWPAMPASMDRLRGIVPERAVQGTVCRSSTHKSEAAQGALLPRTP